MYINHLTINTGHLLRSARADVADDVLRVVAAWLHPLINSGRRAPLPVPELAQFSAAAFTDNGGLVLTLFRPADTPLITLGVAQRSRQGRDLWAKLIAHLDVPSNAVKPAEPWCAVVLHPAISMHPLAAHWIGDFERCVAWAWMTRNPDLSEV